MINLQEIIGLIAAFCTTFSFVPQAIHVYKTQHTKDISLAMFVLFTVGVLFWIFYGISLSSLPIIIANSVTLILAGYILFKKITLG